MFLSICMADILQNFITFFRINSFFSCVNSKSYEALQTVCLKNWKNHPLYTFYVFNFFPFFCAYFPIIMRYFWCAKTRAFQKNIFPMDNFPLYRIPPADIEKSPKIRKTRIFFKNLRGKKKYFSINWKF